ncbi:thiosulfate oxidation carrier protein SoxY [Quatrionicoccus australiensis]|uniref:thiosulfate oxidation carrier protein SoxY n=1 Tax=Quatrionicoccus australiensis TaxID=138118 RepID=UPI001CF8F5D1|nr:thiosulfate oxidation carrier protein SoxY [Quatrionicoccus australiensis]UCV16273.1 thiosulfate oxidation carrier protein SoxY [Quatrionicoccus australiensis]
MQELRRTWLKGGSAMLLSPLLGSSLLLPQTARAADWNRPAFTARTINEALKAYGAPATGEARDIQITAPEISENGAKVDIEISSNLANTRSLAVFADKNPLPLCAALDFSGPVLPYAKLQLKLAESTRIRVVAKTADGKTHVAWRDIKVTLGGCGA